jgi:hypothetical protein
VLSALIFGGAVGLAVTLFLPPPDFLEVIIVGGRYTPRVHCLFLMACRVLLELGL